MITVNLSKRLEARNRPNMTPIMHQDWRDLLFLHWKYDVETIQKTLPPGLFVDTFKGDAYVTIAPFWMKNFRVSILPPLPGLSTFVEINVRTYVYDKNGIPGIWFYSLDLNSFIASRGARLAFYLPYFFSKLNRMEEGNNIIIEGKRKDLPVASAKFTYQYMNKNGHFAEPNTLDFFLIERYILFSYRINQLYMSRVHHTPYPLMEANVMQWNDDLLKINSLPVSNKEPDIIHYSSGVDVDVFKLQSV